LCVEIKRTCISTHILAHKGASEQFAQSKLAHRRFPETNYTSENACFWT